MSSNDRTREFRGNNGQQSYEMQARRPANNQVPQSQPSTFFEATQTVKNNIEKIRSNVTNLQQMHRRAMTEVQSNQAESVKQQIARLTDATSDLINSTRLAVKDLKKIPGEDERVKDNQQKQLAKKLMDVASEFQNIQSDAKKGYRSQMERQYRIARPNATADEVAEAMNNPNGYVFQQDMMSSRVGEQRRLLEDVRSRNNELLKIESSINELFQLFQDMQLLIDNQQVLVDSIDQHVDTTASHLEQGSTELTSAIEHAKSARRKKWWLALLMVILLGVAAFLLYYYVIAPMIKSSK